MDPQSQHFKTENDLSKISVKNDINSLEISLKCSNDDFIKSDQLQIQSNAKQYLKSMEKIPGVLLYEIA